MRSEEYEDAFEVDGSLRDIYILKTQTSDWQTCVAHLRTHYETRFLVDSEEAVLPEDVRDVFELRDSKSVALLVRVNGVWLKTHFFIEEEIELDLDPRDVDSVAAAER
ncbi:MAG: hypothetical protein ACRD1T_27470, partial [Acidimicrobiia bacterium]